MRALPILAALSCLVVSPAAQAPAEKGRLGIDVTEITKPWTGDLSGMAERRMIRVLTTYSTTQYFIDRGTPRHRLRSGEAARRRAQQHARGRQSHDQRSIRADVQGKYLQRRELKKKT